MTHPKVFLVSISMVTAALVVISSSALAADGSASRGEVLAKRWCADCHVVAGDQTRASSDAPSFFALTAGPVRTPETLAAYLALPEGAHSRMPDLHLSRVEIGDIVAYVASLKP